MNKKFLTCFIAIFISLCSYTKSTCIENKYTKDIWINNLNTKDIKVNVVDIKIIKESIYIGKKYNASAILTMNVENNSLDDIELSNIDIYPYQANKETKYFVSTSEDNITGFIGNLKPKESKTIKMGVALHNTKDPISLEFSNIEDEKNEKITESINIK
ncbi:hypothetical protein [Faecalimicrobium dakarense]|uniref:hypothetical protein n=1 Tax=Faecalimicrobium dakarense TaxID=1301100 RepID=UPI0004B41500|nr:hypothetical protein [[Clostridium] dakarense]